MVKGPQENCFRLQRPSGLPEWRKSAWLLTLAVLTLVVPVAGQTSRDPIGQVTLFGEEEFTIRAATKTDVPISRAPGAVTVISAQQIRESGARTIPELLRLVAGVNVRWNPMVQSVDMRGFGEHPFTSRVLLLIDGVPYNSWNKGGFPQHPGFDFFILQNVKRIEVLRGPGSALYGENAYWGVINIITFSGDDIQGGEVEFFGGDLESQSVGALYGKKVGDGSVLFSAKYVQGQLPMKFWSQEQDATVVGADVFFKWTYRGLQFSYYRHEDQMDGFSEDIGLGLFRSAADIDQSVDIVALKYDTSSSQGRFSFGGDLSYASRNGVHCGACHAFAQDRSTLGRTADHGFQLIGDFRLGFHRLGPHNLLLGVEARQIDAGRHTEELARPGSVAGEVITDYTKVATYFQDQISLADDRVNIYLGGRYDGSNDLFDDEISPRLALVWNPSRSLVLRTGWGSAFRFPNFSELYQQGWFISADTGPFAIPLAIFDPNPTLVPEEVRTFDLGLEYRFNPSFSAKLDLFHSEVRDFIVLAFAERSQPVGVRFENHPDDATVEGAELEFRWNLGRRFTGFANWTVQDHEQDGTLVDSSGKAFEFVYSPEHKLNLGTYFGPFAGFGGSVEVQWKDETLAPSFWNAVTSGFTRFGVATLDSYTLASLRLNYDLPLQTTGSGRPVRFSLRVKDLFDEAPVETLVGVDTELPGRQYYGSLSFGF